MSLDTTKVLFHQVNSLGEVIEVIEINRRGDGIFLYFIKTIEYLKNGHLHRGDDLPAREEDGQYGKNEWWVNGERHRENGLPAVEYTNGNKEWWVNGYRHRDGGPAIEIIKHWFAQWFVNGIRHRGGGLPAIESSNGYNQWWVNGRQHREGGLPAIVTRDTKQWYVNGWLHREGGLPAIECVDGNNHWFIRGRKLSDTQIFTYISFCQKMEEKNKIKAQKKIYFWWIPRCYDLSRPCGQRMAQKNLEEFETMMKV